MLRNLAYLASLSLIVFATGCDQSADPGHAHGPDEHAHTGATDAAHESGSSHAHDADGGHTESAGHAHDEDGGHTEGTHGHDDGSVHGDHAADSHEEVSIGTVTIGDMSVEVAQGHGAVAPGKEGHLVVKLPYNDSGATSVRAWIGTDDRTLSYVGRGDYTADSNRYDIHAIAPDPLPVDAKWWIEIEKPDGTKAVGSVQPASH